MYRIKISAKLRVKTLLPIILLVFLIFTGTAKASDFTRFLNESMWRLVRKTSQVQYVVKDHFGILYKLKLERDNAPATGEIAAAIIAEAVGIPVAATYPMFVLNREIEAEESVSAQQPSAELLKQQWLPFSPALTTEEINNLVENDGLRRATIKPMVDSDRIDLTDLRPYLLSELLAILATAYVVGIPLENERASAPRYIGFHTSKHFFLRNYTDAFTNNDDSNSTLADYFSFIPENVFSSFLNDEEALATLNIYISRIEKTQDLLSHRFSKYIKAASPNGYARFLSRISSVRSEMRLLFKQKGINSKFLASAPIKLRPHVHLPALPDSRADEEQIKPSQVDLLWNLYFSRYFSQHSSQYSSGKHVSNSHDGRRQSDRIYFVAPFMENTHHPKEQFTPAIQLHLNPTNSEKLIVVAMNDLESTVISFIAKQAGAHVYELANAHGEKITLNEFWKIRKAADKIAGIKEIVLVETIYTNAAIQPLLHSSYTIRIIDHHEAFREGKEFLNWHLLSSLEQVAQMLGHKLSGYHKIIAAKDRNGVYGLLKLGLPLERVRRMIKVSKQYAHLADLTPYETPYGSLYFITNQAGSIGTIALVLEMKELPQMPNIFILGRDVRFIGSPDIVAKLSELMRSSFAGSFRDEYMGGSRVDRMFWGIQGVSPKSIKQIHKRSRSLIENLCQISLVDPKS